MQKYKKILLGLITVSIICFIAGYIIWHPVEAGLCPAPKDWQDIACKRQFPINSLGRPLFMIPIFVIPVLIIFFFLSEIFYLIWRKFAMVFWLVAILLISIAPPLCNGVVCLFEKDGVTLTLGALFVIISLFIIFYQALKLRKEGNRK